MIRKDVKLGLAIGGVFLAVLVVYLLAVSGGNANQPELVNLDAANATAAAPSAPAPDTSRRPAQSLTIAATPAPSTQSIAMADPVKHDAATTKPANDPWGTVLYAGMPVETQTPQAKPAANQPATTPSASNNAADVKYLSTDTAATGATANVPVPLGAAPSAAAAPRTHVIAAGETFSTIAAMIYGKASYYTQIIAANPTVNPKALRPGMIINLPAVDQVKATANAPRPAAALPAVDSKTEYRVEAGDNLYKISTKLYGKGDRMDKIYELNKSVIGPNKAALKVGMVLKLPEAPTVK